MYLLFNFFSTMWLLQICFTLRVRIWNYSGPYFPVWIRRDTEYLSLFSPNAEKCGPEYGHFWRSVSFSLILSHIPSLFLVKLEKCFINVCAYFKVIWKWGCCYLETLFFFVTKEWGPLRSPGRKKQFHVFYFMK